MQDFSWLGIELLKYGFHPVVFLECECPDHGTFPFGVMPDPPVEQSHCMPRAVLFCGHAAAFSPRDIPASHCPSNLSTCTAL